MLSANEFLQTIDEKMEEKLEIADQWSHLRANGVEHFNNYRDIKLERVTELIAQPASIPRLLRLNQLASDIFAISASTNFANDLKTFHQLLKVHAAAQAHMDKIRQQPWFEPQLKLICAMKAIEFPYKLDELVEDAEPEKVALWQRAADNPSWRLVSVYHPFKEENHAGKLNSIDGLLNYEILKQWSQGALAQMPLVAERALSKRSGPTYNDMAELEQPLTVEQIEVVEGLYRTSNLYNSLQECVKAALSVT